MPDHLSVWKGAADTTESSSNSNKNFSHAIRDRRMIPLMHPVPLEIVLSRMTPHELCEALLLLRRCVRVGLIDRCRAEKLVRRILERPVFRDPHHVATL